MVSISRRLILPLGFLALLAPLAAYAQQAQNPCAEDYEVIDTLKGPQYTYPSVWDAHYAQPDHMVQLAASVPTDTGTVFSFGRTVEQKHFTTDRLMVVELNKRGRALTEKYAAARKDERPVRMIARPDGMLGLSSFRSGKDGRAIAARLTWFDKTGNFVRDKIFNDPRYDYEPRAVVAAADDKTGLLLVLTATARNNASDRFSILMRLNRSGGMVWRRDYRPGASSALTGVALSGDAGYIAVGEIQGDDGRMGGWIARLDAKGILLWQRSYPRGLNASLTDAVPITGNAGGITGGIIVTGAVQPADKKPQAAWVMAVDETGQPLWQRYYRSNDMAYAPVALDAASDGRLSLILNATAQDAKAAEKPGDKPVSKGQSHIRIVTLSPRAQVLRDEGYLDGVNARASGYARGAAGERIVTGTVEPGAKDGAVGQTAPGHALYQGWVVVATPLETYTDPCRQRP